MPQTTPPRHTIVPCTADHLPAVRAIYNDAILHTTALYEYAPRSEEMIREWHASRVRDGIPVLGVEWESGALAGFATWGPFRPRPAYKYSVEHSVYVDHRFRGRGIGRTLLEGIVQEARRRELHVLVAGIDTGNTPSIALHRAVGFQPCGTVRQAGFKFGRWLDLEFWQLVLETPSRPVDG